MLSDDEIDELFDGKPTPITDRQSVTIEANIDNTSFTESMKSEILNNLNDLTEIEAEEIITKIYENYYERDTRKQWEKMFRDGVFGHRDL